MKGLEILKGLWSGKPFSHEGKHYAVEKTVFLPTPLQTPCIPIWVGGVWPYQSSISSCSTSGRAFPLKSGSPMQPKDLHEIRTFINTYRTDNAPFDLVMMGYTPGDDPVKAQKNVEKYAKAGLTWWLESLFRMKNSVETMRTRIQQGPPRPE